jgi:hypothetical protein
LVPLGLYWLNLWDQAPHYEQLDGFHSAEQQPKRPAAMPDDPEAAQDQRF